MAKLLVVVLAVLAVQACLAAPKKKHNRGAQPADESPGVKEQLENLAAQARETVNDVVTKIQEKFPDSKQTTEFLGNQAHTISENVQGIVDKINVEIQNHRGEIDDALKQAGDAIGNAVASLQSYVGADTTGKAQELKANVEETLKKTSEELENLWKTVQPDADRLQESVRTFAKGLYDDFLATAENLQQQVNNKIQEAGGAQ